MKEAYVSFEVARLLKDKGFNVPTHAFYNPKGYFLKFDSCLIDRNAGIHVSAPTHQMVMAWLREKGIHMSIDTVISSKGNIYFNIDTFSKDSGWNHPVDFYNSYEEAIEAALKYSLENLI